MERVFIYDVPVENITLFDLEGYLDKSELKVKEEVYQVPFSHYTSDWVYSYYTLQPNSLVEFVIGEINKEIKEVYFKINSTIITESIQEDIHSFLIKLKLC